MRKGLRSGYTTGACAAAAAKAATMLLLQGQGARGKGQVKIPFPDGSRVNFKIHNSELSTFNSQLVARASVIKDAGDDPDVTNGAEIRAEAKLIGARGMGHGSSYNKDNTIHKSLPLLIKGGKGVGVITKPGLPVPVGEAAINPVPRKMIRDAVLEAIITGSWVMGHGSRNKAQKTEETLPLAPCPLPLLEITISVPDGEKLARKTLNPRLGIIGGISILGTTGIVRPISSEAWTATIISSMDVARAMRHDTIVLSAGRTSEKAHIKKYNLPEESYVMMGDYLEFALLEAGKHGFKEIHLCAQWAKMLKIAMATPQTHVRHGAIDIKKAVEFLKELGQGSGVKGQRLWEMAHEFNTAREIFDFISTIPRLPGSLTPQLFFAKVCSAAKKYAEEIAAGISVIAHLVSYEGEIITNNE